MKPDVFVWIAAVAIATQALSFAALHVLEPGLGVKRSLLSDYLRTPHGWVARLSLASFGITWLAMSLVMRGVLPSGAVSTATIVVMLLAGLSLPYASTLSAAAADPRLAEGPSVLRGALGIFRLGLFLSLIVASIQLRAPVLIVLAALIFALLIATLAVLLDRGVAGIGQRLVFLMTYAWVMMVLVRARS